MPDDLPVVVERFSIPCVDVVNLAIIQPFNINQEMGENFLAAFVEDTQKEVAEELERLVEVNGIKTKVLERAQEYAKIAATHILDETQPPLHTFPAVDIDGDKELQYYLVLEFLQSAGFKFAPAVLKFESQRPDLPFDRRKLGKQLNLRTYDRTPYLVQLIEQAEGAAPEGALT
jgi:hypothetical protein